MNKQFEFLPPTIEESDTFLSVLNEIKTHLYYGRNCLTYEYLNDYILEKDSLLATGTYRFNSDIELDKEGLDLLLSLNLILSGDEEDIFRSALIAIIKDKKSKESYLIKDPYTGEVLDSIAYFRTDDKLIPLTLIDKYKDEHKFKYFKLGENLVIDTSKLSHKRFKQKPLNSLYSKQTINLMTFEWNTGEHFEDNRYKVLKDFGDELKVFYKDNNQIEVKFTYVDKNGRYFKVKGKKYHIESPYINDFQEKLYDIGHLSTKEYKKKWQKTKNNDDLILDIKNLTEDPKLTSNDKLELIKKIISENQI